MAPSMKKSASTSRSFLDQDKYTAELSSGQLVIGITILLVFGLACFLLGVLVGKFEPVERNNLALQVEEGSPAPAAPMAREAAAAKRDTPKTTRVPAPNPSAKAGSASSQERIPEISKTKRSQEGEVVTPRGVDDLQKPASTGAKAAAPRQPKGADPVPFPNSPPPPRASGAIPTIASAKATPKPADPKAGPIHNPAPPAEPIVQAKTRTPDPPRKTAPPKNIPEAAAAKTEGQGSYWTVQIASLSKKESGPRVLFDVESKSPYKVQLVGSKDGKLVTVLAGRFGTRQEAEKARLDIRKRFPQFADCFLKRVP